jgi:hypothetical protein
MTGPLKIVRSHSDAEFIYELIKKLEPLAPNICGTSKGDLQRLAKIAAEIERKEDWDRHS